MTAEAEVRATEDLEKVVKALSNLFTGKRVERSVGDRSFVAIEADEIGSLDKFRVIIQRDQIRAAAGAVLRRSSNEHEILTFLNKQVAYAGHVSFCEPEGESPLGPIRLHIKTNDPGGVVSWVTGGYGERIDKSETRRRSRNHRLDFE